VADFSGSLEGAERMAGFRMHITVSSLCGIVYGGAAVKPLSFEPEVGILAAGVTALGGMLPDLDSDSGRPVRELSALAAAILPMLLVRRLLNSGFTHESVIVISAVLYFLIRYLGSHILRRISVHRGMWHSIPTMVIFGLIVYLEYNSNDVRIRIILAGGVMVGFLSHLILDELYSVDFNGIRIRLNQFAGSALKFFSPSWTGTTVCYAILGLLAYLAYMDSLAYLKN